MQKKSLMDTKNDYHQQVDECVSRINDNMAKVFEFSQIQEKGENDIASNMQLKTSNLIIMQSINDLQLLLQKFKHHRIFFTLKL
jgi:hypothetical protein